MKHDTWDKLLLVLLAALCMASGALLFCLALRWVEADTVAGFILLATDGILFAVLFALIGILLFMAALRVLYVFCIKKRQKETAQSVFIRKSENGSLQLSTAAIDTIIRQYCKKKPEIAECESKVIKAGDESTLHLDIAFAEGVNLAEAVDEIQSGLNEHLDKSYGLHVKGIDITVVPKKE